MCDLISRQKSIQGVRELFSMGDSYCDELSIVGMLNSLPSIESEWISCEERLPENKQCVLGWCRGQIDVVYFKQGISKETREKMQKGEIEDLLEEVWSLSTGNEKVKRSTLYGASDEWDNNKKPYSWKHGPMEYFGQDCVAWMPLPKPYQGE